MNAFKGRLWCGQRLNLPAFCVGIISLTVSRRLWIVSEASRWPKRNSGWMSTACGKLTRSASPTCTFNSRCNASLIAMCPLAPRVRGLVSRTPTGSVRFSAASPSQNRKKASFTPRTFTFETRVCLSGAKTVPFNRIAGTTSWRGSNAGAKNRSAVSACCIVPRRSNVKALRLPRTESPTSNAPVSTPVATAVQSATVRCICQKCFKFFSILSFRAKSISGEGTFGESQVMLKARCKFKVVRDDD